jgi:predicted DNA-binding transcriptional regulator AlpA
MTTETPGPTTPAPLLIDMGNLVAMLDRSEASLERDLAAGRLPTPVRLGGSRKWRRAEILAWVAAGCPGKTVWEEHHRV